MDMKWVQVYTTEGQLEANMIKNFLEASGIPVEYFQESVGVTYGLTVGPLGAVEIFVPREHEDEARQLLEAMDNGDLEADDPADDDPAADGLSNSED